MGARMRKRALFAVCATALLGAFPGGAQNLAQIGGPANPPPASFKGQQFVDSRGCLFLRAGFGGQVAWVARVDRKHKPICGLVPMGSAEAQAAVTADMAPDRPAAAAPRPQTLAEAAPPVMAPPVMAPPAPRSPAAAAYPADGRATAVAGVRCYADAPRLERVAIVGGTALVCTPGDGATSGWRPPLLPQGQAAAAVVQLDPAMAPTQKASAPNAPVMMPVRRQAVAPALPKPPKGWAPAWKDDRLNPLRAIGTPEGEAEQDRIWQRKTPLVPVLVPTMAPLAPATGLGLSTMSAPQAGLLVQVGSYAQAGNAQATLARLAALGLPAGSTQSQRQGRRWHIVYAGPFPGPAQAEAGLTRLHSAGFSDAFLR